MSTNESTPPDEGAAARTAVAGRYSAHELEQVREITTMALYVSLSLLAVLVALPVESQDNRVQAGLAVLGTGVALVLAHHIAFRMSTRLVNEGLLTEDSMHALKAQALGGLPVAVLAALPVFILGEEPGEVVSELLLLALVGFVGYRSARYASSPLRALGYALVVLVLAIVVVIVKLLVGH